MSNEPERSWKALVGSERPPGSPRIDADIVKRLRDHAGSIRREACAVLECNDDVDAQWLQQGYTTELLMTAAANEIERLRAFIAGPWRKVKFAKEDQLP